MNPQPSGRLRTIAFDGLQHGNDMLALKRLGGGFQIESIANTGSVLQRLIREVGRERDVTPAKVAETSYEVLKFPYAVGPVAGYRGGTCSVSAGEISWRFMVASCHLHLLAEVPQQQTDGFPLRVKERNRKG